MPGYEIDRFVGLSQDDKTELICSICQDIFRSPIFTNCCLQTFCEDCINDWLEINNTCPYDRKPLTKSTLTRPPRILMNMLGKLKIRCDFSEKGCNEVLLLENLTQHSLSCHYNLENWKKCEKCLCDWFIKSNHDCIKTLLELNKKANEEMNVWKNKYESTLREIRQLKLEKTELPQKLKDFDLEKENFLKTIQELSEYQNSTTSNNSTITTSWLSNDDILREARKHVLNPKIKQNTTSKEITNKILLIVKKEIRQSNSLYDLCKNIKDKLNQEFGNRWHCMALYNNMSDSCYHYEPGYLIIIEYGILSIELYKTEYFNVNEFRNRFISGKINREIKIDGTDLSESKISNLKHILFEAIENFELLRDICEDIGKKMEKIFGGWWQCFTYHKDFGSYSIRYAKEKYIRFQLAEITFVVYQAPSS